MFETQPTPGEILVNGPSQVCLCKEEVDDGTATFFKSCGPSEKKKGGDYCDLWQWQEIGTVFLTGTSKNTLLIS